MTTHLKEQNRDLIPKIAFKLPFFMFWCIFVELLQYAWAFISHFRSLLAKLCDDDP